MTVHMKNLAATTVAAHTTGRVGTRSLLAAPTLHQRQPAKRPPTAVCIHMPGECLTPT